MLKYLESIGQDSQCNIMRVTEELVGIRISINNNTLRYETLVVRATEDVLIRVSIEFKVRLVHHFVSERVIEEH